MKFLPKFGIRGKILTSVVLLLVLFFVIEALVFYQIVLNGFNKVEERDMVNNIQRVEALINNEINNYSIKLLDWSSWDDTYNFINDKNQQFIDVNLTDATLDNMKLNYMVFIASSGAIIKEKGLSFQTNKEIPVPKDLQNLLIKSNIITRHNTLNSESHGIIRLSDGIILFVSRPILTSNNEGSIRGTLIFARYLDKTFLEKIASLERSRTEIRDYYSNSLPDDFAKAKTLMKSQGVQYKEPDGDIDYYYVNAVNTNEISGYTFEYDINDKPIYIIKNTLERPYFALGNNLVEHSLGVSAVVSVFSFLFAYLILNRMIISRIRKLSADVNLITDSNNSKAKLDIGGSDELTAVAININKMLEVNLSSQEDIKTANEDIKKEKEILAQKLVDFERFNKLTIGRELEMIKLKNRIAELEANPAIQEETKQ